MVKRGSLQKALNLWGIILIAWALYRAKLQPVLQLPEWFDEFVAKPLVFVLPVYYYIKNYEHKKFLSAIGFKLDSVLKDSLLAFAIGGILFVGGVLGYLVRVPTQIAYTSAYSLLFIIIMALVTAFSEEALSRGFVLKRLYEDSKNIYTSSFFASILFFFLHVPILFTQPDVTGSVLLFFMVTNIVLSLVNSFVFLTRGSLIAPILIHAFYNLTLLTFI